MEEEILRKLKAMDERQTRVERVIEQMNEHQRVILSEIVDSLESIGDSVQELEDQAGE